MKQIIFLMLSTVLLVTGCSEIKEPLAPSVQQIAERLRVRDESPERTQAWLVSRGFEQIQRNGFGGVWPKTGPCYQTVKGLRFRAQTITRVCFVKGQTPVVFLRETKGYYWTEVYPNDLSYNLYGPSGLGAISDETVELLEQ